MPKTLIQDNANPPNVTIELDGNQADITLGGHGKGGDLNLLDATGKAAIRLQVDDPAISNGGFSNVDDMTLEEGSPPILLDGSRAKVQADLLLAKTLGLDDGAIRMFGEQGVLEIWHGNRRVRLDRDGNLWLGGRGQDGDLLLFHSGRTDNTDPGQATLHLNGDNGTIIGRNTAAKQRMTLQGGLGNLFLGGQGSHGDVVLFHGDETANGEASNASLHLRGQTSEIIGRSTEGKRRLRIDGARGHIWLGGHGDDGDIMLFHHDQTSTDDPKKATIHLDGDKGDIVLRNADCAEDFEIASGFDPEPGTVMVLDDEGLLRPCHGGYDKRVAGVLSGAGDLRPGLVLGRTHEGVRKPLALMGRVFCQVDARETPIEVGDLLTTAEREGHAMKAELPELAFGSVIGKALRPLTSGVDMIPILVALQ